MQTVTAELRALLPAWAFATLLPMPVATFWREGAGRDFAFAYLFLGTAVLAAESFRTDGHGTGDRWRAKLAALGVLAILAAMTLTAFVWALTGEPTPLVPVLAAFAVAPAVCCVPYLTLASGRAYLAVLFAVLLMAGVKMAGCVVAVLVYGWHASEAGHTALPWERPNLLVWLCWAGAAAVSGTCYWLGRRAFVRLESEAAGWVPVPRGDG